MSDPVKVSASLKELKAALPNSTAEFREMCLEKGYSMAESQGAYIQAQDAEVQDLKAKGAKLGAKVLPQGAGPAAVLTGISAKKQLLARVAEIRQSNPGLARNEAWLQACRENPEMRRDTVVAANVKAGRKRQAAAFAEDFEETTPVDDD